MKRFLILVAGLFSTTLTADSATTFSAERLNEFYDEFACEEKQLLADDGLTSTCYNSGGVSQLPDPPPATPPTPPGPPVPQAGLLPIVIANTSGYPDSEVWVLVQGRQQQVGGGGPQAFIQFPTGMPGTGIGNLVLAAPNTNGGTLYSQLLTDFPTNMSGQRVLYLPNIDSALIFISLVNSLSVPVLASGKIADPAFNNPQDPYGNFMTIWDQVEAAYITTTSPNVNVDATAVSFFSIPLYISLFTAPGIYTSCGLSQTRSQILSYLQSVFATVPPPAEAAQWSGLAIPGGGTVYRVLSPGNAMSAGYFDANYLNNASAYGYSYLADIWTNITSFYQRNPGTLSIEIPGGAIYTGTVQGDNSILFTSGGNTVTFPAPTNGPPYTSSTSYNIFSGLNIFSSATSNADAIQVSKAFEEAIIAGIVPTTSLIHASTLYTLSVFRPYYQINKNLSPRGQSTGPWYSLYSQALHACGLIYTFAYDEPLWPEVLLATPVLTPTTYIGITIGNCQ
jgi:hypothetical protein